MSPSEWIAALGLGGTFVAGAITWAWYVASTLGAMNQNIAVLSTKIKANSLDHTELKNAVHELLRTSQLHESRITRLESYNPPQPRH